MNNDSLYRQILEAKMKPYLTSSHSGSVMSGGFSGHLGGHHHHIGHHHNINHLSHMTPKKRKRTVSADSGCDVNIELSEPNPAILEETVRIWANRLETVLQQEVKQARQMSDASKQALYIADYDMRERVVRSWKDQLLGIMDLTSDLIQCVNNDIKESLTDSAIHSPQPHEDYTHVKEVETINEEDFKALSTDDVVSTEDDHATSTEDDMSSTEQDTAIREKLRHFLEDGEYLENFDYFDQASFETVSLTSDESIEREEPFKPLASSEHNVHAKRDLMPEFGFPAPAATKAGRRRIRKKLGFSRGYFTRAATSRFSRTKAIKKWIKGSKNHYKTCPHHQGPTEKCLFNSSTISEEPCPRLCNQNKNRKQSSTRQHHLAKYKQSNNLLKSKKQIISMIKKLKELKIEQIRLTRGEDIFSRQNSKKRMFQSLLSQEDLFEEWRWTLEDAEEMETIFADWKWNLDEYEEAENIFKEWRWNLKDEAEVENIFKDWHKNLVDYENWNFWKDFGSINEILSNTDEIMDEIRRMDDHDADWTKWKFWDRFGTVKEITHNTEAVLKENKDDPCDEDDTIDPFNPVDPADQDWTQWHFWDHMGPVVSILYYTDTAKLATCPEDDQDYDDQVDDADNIVDRDSNNNREHLEDSNDDGIEDDNDEVSTESGLYSDEDLNDDATMNDAHENWEAWRFWNEIGTAEEILENHQDVLVFGCFEDFVWVGNDDFLKDIGYLGGVVIGDVDDGCLGDEDDEFESLLDGRIKKHSMRVIPSSPGQDSTCHCCPDYGSIKCKRMQVRNDKQAERMKDKNHHEEVYKVCKALYNTKRKMSPKNETPEKIHITDDYFNRHNIFKSLVVNAEDGLIFWDDSDREVDDYCSCLPPPQPATAIYWQQEGIEDEKLIFWEDSSRELDFDDDDLIHLDSADDLYIKRLINGGGDNNIQLFFDNYVSSDDGSVAFDDSIGDDENKENEPWRAYKLLGPLWVDVNTTETDDGHLAESSADNSCPCILKIINEKKSSDYCCSSRRNSRPTETGDSCLADESTGAICPSASCPCILNIINEKKSSSRRRRKPLSEISLVDVNEALWSIEKDGHPLSLREELGNLPFWESPDVFCDACDQLESNFLPTLSSSLPAYTLNVRAKDPLNTFRTWKFLFTEPSKYHSRVETSRRNCRKHKAKRHTQKTNGDLIIEDVFNDWSSWAMLEPAGEVRSKWIVPDNPSINQEEFENLRKLEIERMLRGRKLARNSERIREVNKIKSKRPDSPTVAYTMVNKRQLQAEQNWICSQNNQPTWGKPSPARPKKRSVKPVSKQVVGKNCRIFQPQTRCSSSSRRH